MRQRRDIPLFTASSALKKAGAKPFLLDSQLRDAPAGKRWKGWAKDGKPWSLYKRGEESFDLDY
jgi:hypothetical protein